MKITEKYFPQHSPFLGNPREGQSEAIEQIYDAVAGGKRMFVLAAPTGAGKSVILYAIARAIEEELNLESTGAVFTTSQKLLQDQYQKDFKDMFVLKGRNNYPCARPEDEEDTSCANGYCVFHSDKPDCWDDCPYRIAKQKAIASKIVTTNFAYFIGESNNVNSLGVRRLLVVDEAHNIESSMMSYIECKISQRILDFCQLDIKVPMYDEYDQYEEFLKSLSTKIKDRHGFLRDEIDSNRANPGDTNRLKRLESLSGKLGFILFNSNTCKWVADPNREKESVSFKPINVSQFVKSMVFSFADIVILSSATISKSYVISCLGIPEEDFEYLELPSTFPVDNRPIISLSAGRMGYRYIDKTLPAIVDKVDYILSNFKGKKGIIHATSYKIARYIEENSKYYDRLISHNSVDRIEKLEEHMNTDLDSVLLSPSMTEGVDLKGDLSSFQIIIKIPYPSLADKQIKRRMEIDKIWYAQQAATTMMQAYGRSVRSKDDSAITFVLDSSFKWFVKSNEQLFCRWFKEAIK
jgi:ATP-dependent DNA helicase DinG